MQRTHRQALLLALALCLSAPIFAQTPPPAAAPAPTTPPAATATPAPEVPPTKKPRKIRTAKTATPPATAPGAPPAAGAPVFPTAVSAKYASQTAGEQRMHTCLDQYHANKAANGNGGLKWIQKGGGYYSECSKKLKG